MAKVYPKANPDDELSLEEIASAIDSTSVIEFGEPSRLYLVFVYGGVERRCLLSNKRVAYVTPHGYKANRVAHEVLKHVLRYPHDYLPRGLLLRVLLGND